MVTKDLLGRTIQLDIDGSNSIYKKDDNGDITHKTATGDDVIVASTKTEYNIYSDNGTMRETTKVIAPNGAYTIKEMDALGRVVKEIDSQNNATKYKYDEVGNVFSILDLRNSETIMEYDNLGRVIKKTDPKSNVSTFEYDGNGNISAKIDNRNLRWEYTYDGNNRMISTKDPLKNVSKVAYDMAGNKISETDAENHTTVYYYNGKHQVVEMIDATGKSKFFSYGATGNKLLESDMEDHTVEINPNLVTFVTQAGSSAKKLVTSYTYDELVI